MVKIRLARSGAKKRPFYNIVVADQRRAVQGRFIEWIGYFNPLAQAGEERLCVDRERVHHWISRGAQVTERVASLMKLPVTA